MLHSMASIAALIRLISPNPREGTETVKERRRGPAHVAVELISPNPREGTETLARASISCPLPIVD